jgi:XTP/dITP diphosphohydrolase
VQLLIATTNPGKICEYQSLLAGLDVELLDLKDVGIEMDVAETGDTYAANAELKARAYARLSGLLTLADDSGLEVDALAGRPGVHSARYAADSPARIQKLLEEMIDVPDERRTARFQCAIALAWPAGRMDLACGTCEGYIVHEPHGDNGFGFDPIFSPSPALSPKADGAPSDRTEQSATLGELSEDFKNTISHRARAAQKLRPILEQIARS